MELKHDAAREAAAQIVGLVADLPKDEALAAIGSAFISAGIGSGIDRTEVVRALEKVWAELEE